VGKSGMLEHKSGNISEGSQSAHITVNSSHPKIA